MFYSGDIKVFKNSLGQFSLNRPPKHVITSTSSMFNELKEAQSTLKK